MKLLSWNVYNFNRHLDQALGLILSQDADLVCLQEVPGELLQKLQSLSGVEVAYEIDCFEKGIVAYLVTISRSQITDRGGVNFLHNKRTPLQKLFRWDEGMHALWVDIMLDNQPLRIFNAHLSMGAGPGLRAQQLQEISAKFVGVRHNIICGDLNSFYTPLWGILAGALLGVTRRDFFTNELNQLTEFNQRWQLHEAVPSGRTFPVAGRGFKLDHILLPEQVEIESASILQQKSGSDHFPIVTEFEM